METARTPVVPPQSDRAAPTRTVTQETVGEATIMVCSFSLTRSGCEVLACWRNQRRRFSLRSHHHPEVSKFSAAGR